MVKETFGKIVEIEILADNVRHFVLELDDEINYEAGHFVQLGVEHKGEVIVKPYSICSSVLEDKKKIEFCIKLIEGGKLTPHIFDKKVNDKLIVKGSFKHFPKREISKDKLYFIAMGTGIAPFRSMIFDMLKKGVEKEIVLLFGAKYENLLLYRRQFEKLEEENPNFRFVPILSRSNEDWEGRKGHVQDNLDIVDVLEGEVFICGSLRMMQEVKLKLVEKGMDVSFIH